MLTVESMVIITVSVSAHSPPLDTITVKVVVVSGKASGVAEPGL
jgi:hypothetical protein